MPFKKYYIYSKKEKINTVEDFKKFLIELEYNIIKIYQNFKSICYEIYFLYSIMSFTKSFEKSEKIEEIAEYLQPKNRKVKYKWRSPDHRLIELDKLTSNS